MSEGDLGAICNNFVVFIKQRRELKEFLLALFWILYSLDSIDATCDDYSYACFDSLEMVNSYYGRDSLFKRAL